MGTTQSTVPADQNFNLIDVQRGMARQLNDGTFIQPTTPAADWTYQSLTASGNTLVKTGIGQLHALICGTATGNVTIYDGTSAGGTLIQAAAALVVGSIVFDVSFNTGLFIVLSDAGVAMVTYR